MVERVLMSILGIMENRLNANAGKDLREKTATKVRFFSWFQIIVITHLFILYSRFETQTLT